MSMPVQELERDALNDAKITANSLGCDTDVTITTLMYCLRSKSVNDYLSAIKEFGYIVYFSPIVDGDFVEINPKHIARMSERQSLEEVEFFRSIDILSGFNAYEGVLFLPFVIPPDKLEALKPTRENMTLNYIPSMLNYLYKMDFKTEVTNLVAAQYTNWKDPSDSNSIRLQITKLLGDVSYGTPAIEMARLHKKSNVSRNFMYHFTPTPSRRWIPTPSWIPGATHSDELLFMFGGIGYIGVGEQNAWEIDLVNKMVTYWTNFIKSGDPNIPVSITPRWLEYNLKSGDYLELEKFMSNSSAGRLFYAEEANFWLDVFPALIEAVHKDGSDCDDPVYTSAAAEDPVYWMKSLIMAMLLLQLIRP
ncbi:acetylcholinesterase-like [Mercenaria mercenaria]|uniref:acetylcholinesterase-like n=1 Tax=Mercenaria mercenaria TaxID=6596 RepID=UPI00234F5FA1|nr:acetylcholinesterase-like [Mercenaria mercenaria]